MTSTTIIHSKWVALAENSEYFRGRALSEIAKIVLANELSGNEYREAAKILATGYLELVQR